MSQEHPEARKTSEWRKALWSMVSQGERDIPAPLTAEEAAVSWEQLPDCSDRVAASSLASEKDNESEKNHWKDVNGPDQLMSKDEVDRLESEAAEQWDAFYGHFRDSFFKDRHYLRRELPEVFSVVDREGPGVLFELGCGAGNTAVPLSLECRAAGRTKDNTVIHACDFSANAVKVMTQRPEYDS